MQTHSFKTPLVFQKIFLIIFGSITSVISFAQETKKVDIDINADSGGFFSSPWAWVIGAAVFILLLVALLRGGGSRRNT